jgi:hypothetical protein
MVSEQNSKPVVEYLGVGGPVSFQKKTYALVWSSHPTAKYYKQEYVAKGDSLSHFKTMLLLEAVTGATNLKDVVSAKVAELKAMKEANPVVQYEIFDNAKAGEYLIDFLLTANASDGSVSIVERNVYRYKTFTDKKGGTGILLFGVSERGYGKDVQPFLLRLKKEKAVLVNEVAGMALPAVKI